MPRAPRIGLQPSAFDAFKTLRNRLRLLRPGQVIGLCLRALTHPDAQAWERMRYYRPWELLLLLKWTLLHGEWRDGLTRKIRGDDEFNHLVNLTAEVFNCARLPSQYDAIPLFMRNMAYQQFWLQSGLQGDGIARQSFLFGGLPDSHGFRRIFRERLRLDIPEFIEMSLMLLPKILLRDEPLRFTRAWFSPIADRFPVTAVDAFLDALSLDVQGARDLAASKRVTDLNWELFERTPFQARPILRVAHQYVPISKVLLSRTLELFVYRFLRDLDAAQFMQTFGPLFERYIQRLLDFAGTPYSNERQLIAVCPGKKVVDALLRTGDDNILLEAKGIEFPEIGMITHLPDIVRDRAKPSILKAIDQAYSTVAALYASDNSTIQLGRGSNYLLVITMQDTFLGNGADFFQMVGSDELEKIQRRYGGKLFIGPDHMYFITVHDLEMLCGLIKENKTTFALTLMQALHDDSSARTKKFVFHQHLVDRHERPELLPFLKEEIDRVFTRCERAFRGA